MLPPNLKAELLRPDHQTILDAFASDDSEFDTWLKGLYSPIREDSHRPKYGVVLVEYTPDMRDPRYLWAAQELMAVLPKERSDEERAFYVGTLKFDKETAGKWDDTDGVGAAELILIACIGVALSWTITRPNAIYGSPDGLLRPVYERHGFSVLDDYETYEHPLFPG